MLHNTVGGDFDAPGLSLLCSSSTPSADESARDSPRVTGAAVDTPIPSRVKSMRPCPSAPITTLQIAQRKTLSRTRRGRETGCSPGVPTRTTPPGRPTRLIAAGARPRADYRGANRRRRRTQRKAGSAIRPTGKSPLGNGIRRLMNHHPTPHWLTPVRVAEPVHCARMEGSCCITLDHARTFLRAPDADVGSDV